MYKSLCYLAIILIIDVRCQYDIMPISQSSHTSNVQLTNSTISGSLGIFALELYKAVGLDGNMCISPISIETILSLLYCGSAGQTETILKNVLEFQNFNQLSLAQQYQPVLEIFQRLNANVASAIYVDQQFSIQPTFQTMATVNFNSTINSINFQNRYNAANTINNWVATETNNEINDVISPNDIDSDTKMLIVNAVYLKGKWDSKFDPKATHPQKFHIEQCAENEFKMIPMMHQTNQFLLGWVPFLKSNVIELPYGHKHMFLVIILPVECNGLAEVESLLYLFNYDYIRPNHLWYSHVILTIPKFKIKNTIHWKAPLQSLGLTNIFGHTANFSKILEQNDFDTDFHVSRMVQQVHIDVDESGTEAFAFTDGFGEMLPMPAVEAPPVYVDFIANHPFIFMLMEYKHGNSEILFMGKFTG